MALLDLDTSSPPVYQLIAPKALELHELRLGSAVIARRLGVDHRTVAKGIRWLQQALPPTEQVERPS